MKKSTRGCKVFSVAFISLVLLLISCRKNSGQPTESTTIDLSAYSTQSIESVIESVSAVDFKIDDSWIYLNTSIMTKTENSYAFLDEENGVLQIYDVDGHKKMSRSLFGRGSGEILNVGHIYTIGDTVCIYDDSMGNLLYYDEDGNYIGKWEVSVIDNYLYKISNDNKYIGLYTSRDDGNEYVYIYNKNGEIANKHLSVPNYLKGKNISFGRTPNSYLFNDTLRFILPYDYNIYSVTESSLTTTYSYVPKNPIPKSILKEAEENTTIEIHGTVMAGGYDFMFHNIFETNRYLLFTYHSDKTFEICLFDKINSSLNKMPFPEKFYNKSMASSLTTYDIWQYLIYNISPLYSDGESIYGRTFIQTYEMLKDCEDKLDERLLSLKNNLEEYIKANDITLGDAIIVKISLSR